MYTIIWDNGHASGELSATFSSLQLAIAYADEWLMEMMALDEHPSEAEYSYAIYAKSVEDPVAERDCQDLLETGDYE